MPRAELVCIGSELLLGRWVDTNGPWLARALAPLGVRVARKWVVDDDEAAIAEAVVRAADAGDLVLLSGGLGPTEDDRTRAGVARAAGVPLELRPELLEEVRRVFERLGSEMPPSNRVQAEIPAGAEPIPNPWGTAPGFALVLRGAWVVALPGVPRELKNLFRSWVLPRLRERLGLGAATTRVLRLSGLGESAVGERLRDLMAGSSPAQVALLSSPGEVRVVLTARGATEHEAAERLARVETEVRARLAKFVFGADDETHPVVALRAAQAAGWTLAVAEGFSAGTLASWLRGTGAPAFRGGMVLGPGRIRAAGPTPEARCLAVARRAARWFRADVGVCVAREDELVPAAAADRVWIGVTAPPGARVRSLPVLRGDAFDAQRACHQALFHVRRLAAGV
ncbi:competence/damage-inducible protein A [Deferrisoma camini]|uniref:competence/damage-inducible protein A n=1 Tax=Deferrisoma camini TaxID=1035120 RepID=UPI00046D313E|nr:molybdopterin-binding protein [Deferrisoma camini]